MTFSASWVEQKHKSCVLKPMFVCHCQDVELGGQSRSPATWDPAQEGWRAEGGETSPISCFCKPRPLTTPRLRTETFGNVSVCVNVSPAGEKSHFPRRSQTWRQEPLFCLVLFGSGFGSCSLKSHLLFLDSPQRWQTQAGGPGSGGEQVSSTETRINVTVVTGRQVASDTRLASIYLMVS